MGKNLKFFENYGGIDIHYQYMIYILNVNVKPS